VNAKKGWSSTFAVSLVRVDSTEKLKKLRSYRPCYPPIPSYNELFSGIVCLVRLRRLDTLPNLCLTPLYHRLATDLGLPRREGPQLLTS
jgi:hypothetical protein